MAENMRAPWSYVLRHWARNWRFILAMVATFAIFICALLMMTEIISNIIELSER